MSLKEYHAKRNFKKTAEPKGKLLRRSTKSGLNFVVQKHNASHLHYDFRLELGGVLRSWAVPKGPSLDPKEKRLAVEVEDHPIEYGDFEGEIPEKEYGGGHVIVWDRGEWVPPENAAEQIKKGRLEFSLRGEKLKGKWLLIRTGGKLPAKKANWLLFKRSDEFARSHDDYDIIEEEPKSVISGVTVEQLIADMTGTSVNSTPLKKPIKKSGAQKKTSSSASSAGKVAKKKAKAKPKAKRNAALPEYIRPQLARLVERPPSGEEWVHEIKFDGYRTLARIENGKVTLVTRNGHDWTEKYAPIAQALKKVSADRAFIDGEIVALDENGKANFQTLQSALKLGKRTDLVFYAFDLLHLNGEDLTEEPLLARKKLLKSLVSRLHSDQIRYSEHWQNDGREILKASCGLNLEGIISKRADEPYESGRGPSWLKAKCKNGQEFVIGGYSAPQGSRSGFGALLLGHYNEQKKLVYAGRVGTGFDSALLESMSRQLKKLATKTSPFDENSPKGKDITWVKPKLVANVEFAEWTSDGVLRHASFQGLREDKTSREVVLEKKTTASKSKKAPRLTHPDKVLYLEAGYTKARLAEYYGRVEKWILPHLKDRPLSLLRCPDGEGSTCFFQKHLTDRKNTKASGLHSIRVASKFRGETEEIIYVEELNGLHELVQMGVLEIHGWGCHRNDIDRPDLIVFDLDPDPSVTWKEVVRSALEIRELLKQLKLQSFVKVTGGKGVHIHVPIQPDSTWPQVKGFAKAFVSLLAKTYPERYTSQILKAKRSGKIFLDYLRNGYGATAVIPYSLRAKANAPVALPVSWKELNDLKSPDLFTLEKAEEILRRRRSDPWKGYFELKQAIPKAAAVGLGDKSSKHSSATP